jgi:hypothetical protein
MTKPRLCPHCKKSIPIDRDFYFDDELNMIHTSCVKVVFAARADEEKKTYTYNNNSNDGSENQPTDQMSEFHGMG